MTIFEYYLNDIHSNKISHSKIHKNQNKSNTYEAHQRCHLNFRLRIFQYHLYIYDNFIQQRTNNQLIALFNKIWNELKMK